MRILLPLLVALLSGCVNVKIEQGDASQFRQHNYKTYAWDSAPIAADPRNERLYNLDRYLRRAVDKDLTGRGYQLVDKAQAGFLVNYRYYEAVVNDQGGIISPSDELAGAWDLGGDVNNTQIHNHYIPPSLRHAFLELQFIDRADNQPVWSATARKIIEDENADLSSFRRGAEKLADKLLKTIPAR